MTPEEQRERWREIKRAQRTRDPSAPPRKGGRPLKLDIHQQAWLVRHWMDPRLTEEDMAEHLGLGVHGVYLYKARLRLPNRPYSPTRHRDRIAALIASNQRRERAMSEEARKYQPRSKKGRGSATASPLPTVFRCPYCGGRSTDPEGHSGCIVKHQGRAA